MSDACTLITEHFVRGLCNHRLRFGAGHQLVRRGGGITVHVFGAHKTFGMVRWTRNDYGTILWNLYIGETQNAGRVTQIPGVYPGADLLFRSRGTKATRRVLARLSQLEKRVGGDLSAVPATYWRAYHHAQICRTNPPPLNDYLAACHA